MQEKNKRKLIISVLVILFLASILNGLEPTKVKGATVSTKLGTNTNSHRSVKTIIDASIAKKPAGAFYGGNKTYHYGGNNTIYVGPYDGSADDNYRGFVQFDLTSIPIGSTITSATFYIRSINGNTQDGTFRNKTIEAFKVKKRWINNTYAAAQGATAFHLNWAHYMYSTVDNFGKWTAEGADDTSGADADREATASSSFLVNVSQGDWWNKWYSMNISTAVQDWVNTPLENNGLILIATNETDDTAVNFASSEHATKTYRPYLEVTYQTPTGVPNSHSALVIVNNNSSGDFSDFSSYVFDALRWWGIDFEVFNLATGDSLTQSYLEEFKVIYLAHSLLGLSSAQQDTIRAAVNNGVGLVNADFRVDQYNSDFQAMFGLTLGTTENISSITTADNSHFITKLQDTDQVNGFLTAQTVSALNMSTSNSALMHSSAGADHHVLVAATYGSGKVVQFGFANALWNYLKLGYIGGYDNANSDYAMGEIIWRSIVWAAQKPFAMRGLPALMGIRIDDIDGDCDLRNYIDNFSNKGYGVFLSLFSNEYNGNYSSDYAQKQQNGEINIGIHSRGYNSSETSYWDIQNLQEETDVALAAWFSEIDTNMTNWGFTFDKTLATHYYAIGHRASSYLQNRNADYVFQAPRVGAGNSDGWSSTWVKPFQHYQIPIDYGWIDREFINIGFGPDHILYSNWINEAGVDHAKGRLERAIRKTVGAKYPLYLLTHENFLCNSFTPSQHQQVLSEVENELPEHSPYLLRNMLSDEIGAYVEDMLKTQVVADDGSKLYLAGTSQNTIYLEVYQEGGSILYSRVPVSPMSNTASGTTYNNTPGVPSLISPSNNAQNVSLSPNFQISATDLDRSTLKYKIQIAKDSSFSNIVYTIDQTQSGQYWDNGTNPYTSGSTATYSLHSLDYGSKYYWRAYAIDPNGTNNWSSGSSIYSFTTLTQVGGNGLSGQLPETGIDSEMIDKIILTIILSGLLIWRILLSLINQRL